jgi:hypothetical protein
MYIIKKRNQRPESMYLLSPVSVFNPIALDWELPEKNSDNSSRSNGTIREELGIARSTERIGKCSG